jgi:hypothetical protein
MIGEAVNKESTVANVIARRDYLFTWKDGERWPLAELRKLVDTFNSEGYAKEPWTCLAYRQIQPGDHAYLLKQGRPRIGIFGRGRVGEVALGEVLIGFDVKQGDVLWDPGNRFDQFLVSQEQLFSLPVPRTQWQNQAAGIKLASHAARQIDNMIADSLRVGRHETTSVDETVQEIARVKKVTEQSTRPDQHDFRTKMRMSFQDTCAVTGCTTPAALEAAHISTKNGLDDNRESNGILLRSDIHLLFDRLLITLSEDGIGIEVSPELTDQGYSFLRSVQVTRPDKGPPSKENIREHRNLFFERQRRRSGRIDVCLGPTS